MSVINGESRENMIFIPEGSFTMQSIKSGLKSFSPSLNKNLMIPSYSGGVIMPNSAAALKEAVEFEKKALEKYQEAVGAGLSFAVSILNEYFCFFMQAE